MGPLLFTSDGTMIYNQRAGGLWARRTDGRITQLTADLSDLNVSGEAGLMGMVVDPDFATNRQIYTCQSHTAGGMVDNRVIKWSIDPGYTTATRVGNTLVTGIAQTASIHAGCRLRFDANKLQYVSTGDSALGPAPQDPTGLNGKVLRVTSVGAPAPGNPFIGN
jgi:glucose/arabinose dehydrogenase